MQIFLCFVQTLISKRLALEIESRNAIDGAVDSVKTKIQVEALISHDRWRLSI